MNWRKALNKPGLTDDEVASIRNTFNAMTGQQQQVLLQGSADEKEDWALGCIVATLGEVPEGEETTPLEWLYPDGPEFVQAAQRHEEAIRHTKHAMGCFQAAGDDEPVFTLRAKDAFAPAVIVQWALMVEAAQKHWMTDDEWAHTTEKLDDARHCARAMVDWQRNNTHKIPD